MKSALTRNLYFTLLIIFVAISFLFSEKPDSEQCGTTYRITQHLSIYHDCDSWEFLDATQNPSVLLKKNYVRQSRPLYILAGTVFGYSLKYSAHFVYELMGWKLLDQNNLTIFWFVMVLINFMVCLFALNIFYKVVKLLFPTHRTNYAIYLLSILLISNSLVKVFFWTAHQQMFNILTPLFCFYLILLIIKNKINNRGILLYSLTAGLCLLIYGNFILVLPCIIIAVLYRERFALSVRLIKLTIGSSIIFLLPTLIWLSYLTLTVGHYYNHAVEKYRQFVWIKDSLEISFVEFYYTLIKFTNDYLYHMGVVLIGYLILFIVIRFLNKILDVGRNATLSNNDLHISTIICGVIFFLFYWLLGFYIYRLTYCFIPIILIWITLDLQTILDKYRHLFVKIMLSGFVLLYHIFNVYNFWPIV